MEQRVKGAKSDDVLDSDDDDKDEVEASNPLKIMAEKEVPARY